MTAVCLDVYIVGRLILGSVWISGAAACVLVFVFGALWFAFPLAWRQDR